MKNQVLLSRDTAKCQCLVEKTEADSAAHVIRNGIRIYDILATEVLEKHGSVFLKDGETGETIRLELF